jgi:flagellar basal body rod protein FlgB
MLDGISSSLAGMANAVKRISNAAENISQAQLAGSASVQGTGKSNVFVPKTPVHLDDEMVKIKFASVQYKTNVKLLKAQVDTEKEAIDILT